jgi:hypothetical protein
VKSDILTRVLDALDSDRKRVSKMLVSNRTYQMIRHEVGEGLDVPREGQVGTLFSVDLIVDSLVPNGQVALVGSDGQFIGLHTLEPTPAVPLDPYQRVARVIQEGDGRWVAQDAAGQHLLELTEEGAARLRERLRA